MEIHSHLQFDPSSNRHHDRGLQRVLDRLCKTIERDALVRQTTNQLRELLEVDRVVLYYFYGKWEGQVTFESLSDRSLSIFGSTGPDDCFNNDYADMYLKGRVRAIADIELEPIHPLNEIFSVIYKFALT